MPSGAWSNCCEVIAGVFSICSITKPQAQILQLFFICCCCCCCCIVFSRCCRCRRRRLACRRCCARFLICCFLLLASNTWRRRKRQITCMSSNFLHLSWHVGSIDARFFRQVHRHSDRVKHRSSHCQRLNQTLDSLDTVKLSVSQSSARRLHLLDAGRERTKPTNGGLECGDSVRDGNGRIGQIEKHSIGPVSKLVVGVSLESKAVGNSVAVRDGDKRSDAELFKIGTCHVGTLLVVFECEDVTTRRHSTSQRSLTIERGERRERKESRTSTTSGKFKIVSLLSKSQSQCHSRRQVSHCASRV